MADVIISNAATFQIKCAWLLLAIQTVQTVTLTIKHLIYSLDWDTSSKNE